MEPGHGPIAALFSPAAPLSIVRAAKGEVESPMSIGKIKAQARTPAYPCKIVLPRSAASLPGRVWRRTSLSRLPTCP